MLILGPKNSYGYRVDSQVCSRVCEYDIAKYKCSRDSLDLLFVTMVASVGIRPRVSIPRFVNLYIPRPPRHALLDTRLALIILLCSAILN